MSLATTACCSSLAATSPCAVGLLRAIEPILTASGGPLHGVRIARRLCCASIHRPAASGAPTAATCGSFCGACTFTTSSRLPLNVWPSHSNAAHPPALVYPRNFSQQQKASATKIVFPKSPLIHLHSLQFCLIPRCSRL